MNKRIVLTGGGSAGHVTANLVLISRLLKEEWEIHYIGSKHGIERELVSRVEGVRYSPIATGKLRRYWAWENVTDLFKIMLGLVQSYRLISRIKPDVVFSLGGFVAVPVVIGTSLNSVPVIILEPDLHPGLANRISRKFARVMCSTFTETAAHDRISDGKIVHVGPIVREELKHGSRTRGIHLSDFNDDKPVLLVMGGSQGADRINRIIRDALPDLLRKYQIIHICGVGKTDITYDQQKGYKQFEFVHDELPDLIAMADLVVSRAGSNAIHELLLLQKPMLLIPHAIGGTRAGQTLNAQFFRDAGYAELLHEEAMTKESFLQAVEFTYRNRRWYTARMRKNHAEGAIDKVMEIIGMTVRNGKKNKGI
ncbi:undecaprenyldiphospho-muramoylpentapeptide beta-N-acetylglucosaminyltransferase [Brevibacillus laterosporus]|uniref:undecaprenyldiphospho-muramoylpentapeptide beta-N-acetylglucosaminyltransferase n=1 Tax=Brevibacillus laterosporus TaxID=1465 RepID=UPI0035A6E74F